MTASRTGSKRGAARRLSKDALLKREKAIIADIKGGVLSYRQIAEKHRVSLPTVNNKARKAGISRGRRKGAKILVMGPRRRATSAKKVVRRGRRKVARKKAVGRRPAARRKTTRRARKIGTRRVRTTSRRGGNFSDAFRELVLQHFPDLSLRKFDRLSRLVGKAVS
jgi:DNA-binding CsgD family transcriptional regulator